MKTFITSITGKSGQRYAGPKFQAMSWAEAQTIADDMGVILEGELAED